MNILGIGGILSDAAAALLKDGVLAAAIEERKIARQHNAGDLPEQSIAACLQMGGIKPEEIDCIALVRPFSDGTDSTLHLHLRVRFQHARLVAVEHHTAHAASAYYPSPFDSAAVLTLDRAGDFRCGARWLACGTELRLDKELYYPDSLGDLYGRVTELLGYRPNADEHKVQWLSTAGDRRFIDVFDQVLGFDGDGWPRLDRTFFDRDRITGGAFSEKFYSRLGLTGDEPVSERLAPHIAAGLQHAVERAAIRMAGDAQNVCLAGGLGLNTLVVAALERERNVFVQPAAGNSGTAIGAVLHAWHAIYKQTVRTRLRDLYLGPSYSSEEVKRVLENCKLRFRYLPTSGEIVSTALDLLNNHQIVAWMQGSMEFGPRALGNRSILASPLNTYSTENLNVYIKHREPFRKFAASVPVERVSEFFEAGPNSRFLATVGRVRPEHRKTFEPAILGDGAIRIHTVEKTSNPLYYSLLEEAGRVTGLPVLYNTSFNLFHEPLVCSPRDAARSFYSSGIDAMVVGHFLLQK